MDQEKLKQNVHDYWNKSSCGTEIAKNNKFSLEYFQEVEEHRYKNEPEIFSFAQFTKFKGQKLLEVGVGAGTDFLQWVRAGAKAYGIDLTQEAIKNTQNRLKVYDLNAYELKVADAESLPYQSNDFDIVYSWGVIHHSPNFIKCLEEIIRVARPGGTIKLMIYNRHSLFAFYRWLLAGLFKGRPFQSLKTVLFNSQESLGTKAFTFKEIKETIKDYPVSMVDINASVTRYDLLKDSKYGLFRFCAYCLACILGWNRVGWFMTIELKKR